MGPKEKELDLVFRFLFVFFAALGLVSSPARADSPDWKQLMLRYQREVARNPDTVEGRFSLAVVYAHEGRLIDGWEQLKRVDQLVGGGERPGAGGSALHARIAGRAAARS